MPCEHVWCVLQAGRCNTKAAYEKCTSGHDDGGLVPNVFMCEYVLQALGNACVFAPPRGHLRICKSPLLIMPECKPSAAPQKQ